MPRIGRTIARALLQALVIASVSPDLAEAGGTDHVRGIIGKLSSFHNGTLTLFESAGQSLRESGARAEADKVKAWANDWLSIFGVSKGITGLAKDFVLHYLGRSSYHDNNGRLIGAINHVANSFPAPEQSFRDTDASALRRAVLDVCSEGMSIFKEGDSLHTMLSELSDILKVGSNTAHFAKSLKSNPFVKKAFEYLASAPPGDGDGQEDDDEL